MIRILIVQSLGMAVASAIADAMIEGRIDEDDEFVVNSDPVREIVLDSPPVMLMPDTREFIREARRPKDPDRHRPRDQYNRKQGWKPR